MDVQSGESEEEEVMGEGIGESYILVLLRSKVIRSSSRQRISV